MGEDETSKCVAPTHHLFPPNLKELSKHGCPRLITVYLLWFLLLAPAAQQREQLDFVCSTLGHAIVKRSRILFAEEWVQ